MLDEADRLLEQSFETELRVIAGCLPARRQTLLFSATLTRSLAMLQASTLWVARTDTSRCCLVAGFLASTLWQLSVGASLSVTLTLGCEADSGLILRLLLCGRPMRVWKLPSRCGKNTFLSRPRSGSCT